MTNMRMCLIKLCLRIFNLWGPSISSGVASALTIPRQESFQMRCRWDILNFLTTLASFGGGQNYRIFKHRLTKPEYDWAKKKTCNGEWGAVIHRLLEWWIIYNNENKETIYKMMVHSSHLFTWIWISDNVKTKIRKEFLQHVQQA